MSTAYETKSEVANLFQMEQPYLKVIKKVRVFAGVYNLTKREVEILTLMIVGHSNKAIAVNCYISEKTVKHHFENIKGKISVHSFREVIALFINSMLAS